MALLDPELLLEFELLLLPELLELELASPLDVDALEPLTVPLLAVPELAVSDELLPVLDACASSSTLSVALLIWPDELDPVPLAFEGLAALTVEFD